MDGAVLLNEVTMALSDALDMVGVEDVNHGKRVGYMAAELGRALGLDEQSLTTLLHAGLLHDLGVSSTRVHNQLGHSGVPQNSGPHCERGASLLAGFEPLHRLGPLVLHHHTPWERLKDGALSANAAVLTNLVAFADHVDVMLSADGRASIRRYVAREEVHHAANAGSGTLFHPDIVRAFNEVSRAGAFWFTLKPRDVREFVVRHLGEGPGRTLDLEGVAGMAQLFSAIVDAKSAYTLEHSAGVGRLTRYLGETLGLPAHTCKEMEIAGLLHDIGKLSVPDEILEKPSALTSEERALMQRHSFDTYKILKRIRGLDEIALWAGHHHEHLDGTGYPFCANRSGLPLEARVLAVADVFQALAQRRPYREGMPPATVLKLLHTFVAEKKLDGDVVNLVAGRMDACWDAALQPQAPHVLPPDVLQPT